MAAPSKLTDELRDEICKLIEEPMHPEHAAYAVGITPRTYYRWMAEGEADDATDDKRQFFQACARARTNALREIVGPIHKAALGGEVTRKDRQGNTTVEWENDWKAAAWLAEKMAPDQYGNRQRIDVATADSVGSQEFDEETEAAARAFVAKATGYEAV